MGYSPMEAHFSPSPSPVHIPYYAELDTEHGIGDWLAAVDGCDGAPAQVGNLSNTSYPWGYTESGWYANQSKEYRDNFLKAAYHHINCRGNNGHVLFLGRRSFFSTSCPGDYGQIYSAYTSCNASGAYPAYDQEEMIKKIWDANDGTNPNIYYSSWTRF